MSADNAQVDHSPMYFEKLTRDDSKDVGMFGSIGERHAQVYGIEMLVVEVDRSISLMQKNLYGPPRIKGYCTTAAGDYSKRKADGCGEKMADLRRLVIDERTKKRVPTDS